MFPDTLVTSIYSPVKATNMDDADLDFFRDASSVGKLILVNGEEWTVKSVKFSEGKNKFSVCVKNAVGSMRSLLVM